MTTLNTIFNTLEPTDELIMLNKHYDRLVTIDEKISEIIELIENLDSPDLECMNGEIKMYAKKHKRFDMDKALKDLKTISQGIGTDYTLTSMKSHEIFTFQKLGKAISIHKHIKEDKDPY